jgi:hypothetical protein
MAVDRSPLRRSPRCHLLLTTSILLLAAAEWSTLTAQTPFERPVLIRGATVFDGQRSLGTRDVLVREGRIAAIGASLSAPTEATVVEGHGRTLLPGLIDGHTHVWGEALVEALTFGVTTELDMFTVWRSAGQARTEQRAGKVPLRADLFSGGTLATAPGGHGTQYGMTIPTISSPDSAQAFVEARIAEGSDWIKIVFDGGRSHGMSTPTIDLPSLRALIVAALHRGRYGRVRPRPPRSPGVRSRCPEREPAPAGHAGPAELPATLRSTESVGTTNAPLSATIRAKSTGASYGGRR